MNLEDFIKTLPKIIQENKSQIEEGEGEFLVEDRIIYPVDWEFPKIGLDFIGKATIFDLEFENIPQERFPRSLLEDLLKMTSSSKDYQEIELYMIWDNDSFQREVYDVTSLDELDILASAKKSESDWPWVLSANFCHQTATPCYQIMLSGNGVYSVIVRRLAKKFGLIKSQDKAVSGFIKQYEKNSAQAREDIERLVRDIQELEVKGHIQEVMICGGKNTNSIEYPRIELPRNSRFYRLELC